MVNVLQLSASRRAELLKLSAVARFTDPERIYMWKPHNSHGLDDTSSIPESRTTIQELQRGQPQSPQLS